MASRLAVLFVFQFRTPLSGDGSACPVVCCRPGPLAITLRTFFFCDEKWSRISPSVTRSTSTLLKRSGSHGEPHAQLALCWRRLESTVSPTTTWQTPSQQCIPTVAPTSQPSRADLVPHGFRSCLGFGLGQSTQEVGSLVRPSPSDFGCKDDQTGASSVPS